MDTRALSSGDVLSGRYRLEDLISESNDSFIWRAADQTLNRSVCIQAMAAADTRVPAFLQAARNSTTVTDPRFLRILDIVENEQGQTYLVREWARAVSLDRLLRQSTLPNRRSATIVSEIAEAIANAHESGMYHLHLGPSAILIKDSGAVRITGLAIDQALRPAESVEQPVGYEEQADVEAVGKLLYVCLAGRWPGGRCDGLKAAPAEHGRLLRPRQVRAGVSRDVDTVCDRILGTPPRHSETPLRSARDIAHELRLAGDDDALVTDDQPSLIGSSPDLFNSDIDVLPQGPPPAVHPPKRKPKALQPPPPTTFEKSRAAAVKATKGDRKWIAGGIAVLLVVAVSIGVVLGRQTEDPAGDSPAAAQSTVGKAVQPLPIEHVSDFDPWGEDGTENPEQVGSAYDQKPDTAWTTLWYNTPDLGNLKPGVGLLVDLGKTRSVASVDLMLNGGPTDVSIFTADPEQTTAPTQLSELERVQPRSFPSTTGDSQLTLNKEYETRWVLIWLTKLPQDSDGNYRGRIAEVTVRGTP